MVLKARQEQGKTAKFLQEIWDNYHKDIIESINNLKISKKRKNEMRKYFIIRQKSFIFLDSEKR